jgi:hypothetical protein
MNFRLWLEQFNIKKQTEGDSILFYALHNNQEIAVAEIHPDKMIKSSAIRFFPNLVKPNDTVWRLQQIGIYDEFRNQYLKKGVGKTLWTHIFNHLNNDWLANSQLGFPDVGEFDAITSLQSFHKHGFIELHWMGGPGRFFIARKSDSSQQFQTRGYFVYDYLKLGSKSFTASSPDDVISQSEQLLFIPLKIFGNQNYSIPEPFNIEFLALLEKLPKTYGNEKKSLLAKTFLYVKNNMKPSL